jgi:4-amino-4-deoxy-L-arabinose transferase-like glycosyltransferase
VVGAAAPRAHMRERVRDLTRRLPGPVLLGALTLFIGALNVLWRTLESRPPHWDMGHHLANSIVYLHGFSFAHPVHFLDAYLFYPPFVYWVTDVFYATFGSEAMWVAVLSNIVWLAVLVFATYGIGRRLWNSRVGWLSVVFVVTAPMIVSSSKEYMLDLPLTAVAALSLYLLMRADGFTNRRYSLLFGIWCGCGLLVKWTLPLVLALPVVHATATALTHARVRRRFRPLLNLAGAAALTFAVAGTWYVHNFRQVVGASLYYSGPEGVMRGNPPVATLESALWYLWNLLDTQLYLIPFLFVLAGILFCFRKRELAARNVYPILMVVGTYATFTLLRHKDPRYTLPMLPALAIVATSWLEYLSQRARVWGATVLVAYGAIAFLAISFGTSLLPKSITFDAPSTSFGPPVVTLFGQHGYIIGPPTHENWHQDDPFRTIASFPQAERSFAYEGPDTVWFNKHGLSYYAQMYRVKWVEIGRGRFLLDRGEGHATPRGYARLERWRLPDGGTLALYSRS